MRISINLIFLSHIQQVEKETITDSVACHFILGIMLISWWSTWQVSSNFSDTEAI